jgi:hypothetical protein
MQVDQKVKTQTLTITLSPPQAFYRTPFDCAQKTTMKVPQELGTLNLLSGDSKTRLATT